VDFIDSTGLSVLIGALKRSRETNSEFELTGVGRGVRIVLEMSGLSALFGL
jgi:anti-sigma B factor antagonist